MTRKKLTQALFDNYLNESDANRLRCQNVVFEYYYDRNDHEIELTLEEIRADIKRLAQHQEYERCLMLKHILERFE